MIRSSVWVCFSGCAAFIVIVWFVGDLLLMAISFFRLICLVGLYLLAAAVVLFVLCCCVAVVFTYWFVV